MATKVFYEGDFIAEAGGSMTVSGNVVTETLSDGTVVTTTFNANGSITTVYPAPISKTVTTTINANGSITRTVT